MTSYNSFFFLDGNRIMVHLTVGVLDSIKVGIIFFNCSITFYCMVIPHFMYPLVNVHLVVSTFGKL